MGRSKPDDIYYYLYILIRFVIKIASEAGTVLPRKSNRSLTKTLVLHTSFLLPRQAESASKLQNKKIFSEPHKSSCYFATIKIYLLHSPIR